MFANALSKRILKGGSLHRLAIRSFSSSKDLVLTTVDADTGVATLTMNQAPVNSLSMEMCQAISSAIIEIEKEPRVQSLVLASSLPSVFCAGLDIMEMHKPDDERLTAFWNSFQQLYFDLYGSRLATIAAIAGHAPAAGCMLALCCDYRIMASVEESQRASTIGLNETKLGIVAPPWLAQQYADTVGQRHAELGLSLGLLYTSNEALAMGLVDELASKDKVLKRSQDEAAEWAKVPPKARYASKLLARKPRMDNLVETRQIDNDFFRSYITNDTVQRTLDGYLQSLTKKK